MGKEIIKYHNDMNKVSFAGFKEKELDLFFSICQKMKDNGTNEITFSFSDLRKLSQYSNRSIERFYSDLDRVYKKMLELNLKYEDDKELRRFVLFSRYIIKKEKQLIIIKASEDFEYILNKLIGTFTKFDLVDFVSLKSIYSKNMFKLLKQWESKKYIKYKVQELRYILGVPTNYSTSNFNDRVLKPILKELPIYFKDLNLEKIKTGRKITHLKFTWSSKKHEIKEAEVIEIVISKKIQTAINKAKKNRFINKLLNDDNIKILVESFNEEDLIKGLQWAYKEVQQEINSINYLIKAIKTGAEKMEKKIIIKQKSLSINESAEPAPIEDLEEVTSEELTEAKKLYLKETGTKSFNSVHEKIFSSTKNTYIKQIRKQNQNNTKEKVLILQSKYNKLIQLEIEKQRILNDIEDRELLLKIATSIVENTYTLLKDSQVDIDNTEHSNLIKQEMIESMIQEQYRGTPTFTECQLLALADIEKEKLLSKKGKKLFGGALIARLESIAKKENIKIKYKDRIIG